MNHDNLLLIDRIQSNFVLYFRLFAGLPNITFVEEGVTWLVNAGGEPDNHVLRTCLEGEAIDREIDRVLQQIGQLTNHIDWLVFPGCRPADLGQRLTARGLIGQPVVNWMVADLAAPPATAETPAGFTVRQVKDDAMLAEWQQVSAAGFGMDVQIYYDAYARHGYGPDAFSLHYIGYQGGQPVTSATLLLSDGIAGIYDISTPPAWRAQGYGSAITAFTVQAARELGYQVAWLWSSDQGKGMYSHLGFTEIDFGVREHSWRAAA
jgi:GNAT superfamily N-acetyltransferase